MDSETPKMSRLRTSNEVDSRPPSRRHHHSHRNGSSHRSSQLLTTTHETLARGDETAGLQVEHRVSSRRHHSHHHRHRHRLRHEGEDETEKDTAAAATKIETKPASNAAPRPAAQQQQLTCQAPESSRASVRSSRLPMRRSERVSVASPDISTYENPSFHGVHPTTDGTATADRPSRKPSRFSAAPSSSANFPPTSELNEMTKRGKTTATLTAAVAKDTAKQPIMQSSATHSSSFASSSYISCDNTIDFQTNTHHKTTATAATTKNDRSHTVSSINFLESSPQTTTEPPATVEAAPVAPTTAVTKETKAATAPPPPSTSVASKRNSHESLTPQPRPQQQQKQPVDIASKRSRMENDDKTTTPAAAVPKSVTDRNSDVAAVSSSRAVERFASLNSVSSPILAAADGAPGSPGLSAATAALAALKTAPQPDALVRSWQADVTPDAHNPPSSLTSSVCRGRERDESDKKSLLQGIHCLDLSQEHQKSREEDKEEKQSRHSKVNLLNAPPQQHESEEENQQQQQQDRAAAAAAASVSPRHRHRHGESSRRHHYASTPSAPSLHRDSRSSSKYDKANYPNPEPFVSVKNTAAEEKGMEEAERRSNIKDSQDVARAASSIDDPIEKLHATYSPNNRPPGSTNGQSPQRTRNSSVSNRTRRLTEFEPFKLNTERRSTIRRTSSPQAYVAHDPLTELPKEERERLMSLPHDAFNVPGTWRLDMRYEEDRKEFFRQTHLVDPLTRTRPGMRQFYIPEQADLFGMYPNIPMTKDEEGNDIVEHRPPVPIQGESFVKKRKPYGPPRRKSTMEENQVCPIPPPRLATATNANTNMSNEPSANGGRPGRGLSGFVWGYGEEANGRPGGLTPPRGHVVSDITAPYRRNPAKSTGQIGHLGGDGTLNIFHMSASTEGDVTTAADPHHQQLQYTGFAGTPPQTSLGRQLQQQQLRDISLASTPFAIIQPMTTNSDYGQSPKRYTEAATHVAAPVVVPTPQPQPSSNNGKQHIRKEDEGKDISEALTQSLKHQHQPTAEAVVLQPSVGGYSGSRSPSEEAFAPPRSTSPVTQDAVAAVLVLPTAIRTGGEEDGNSEVKSVDRRSNVTEGVKSKPKEAPRPWSRQHPAGDDQEQKSVSDRFSCRKPKGEEEQEASEAHKRQEPVVLAVGSVKKASLASEKCHQQHPQLQQPQQHRSSTSIEKSEPSGVKAPSAAPAGVAKPKSSTPQTKSSKPTPAPFMTSTSASAHASSLQLLNEQQPAVVAAASTVSLSSGLRTPTSAKPDSVYPVPSPAPDLPASSRVSKEHEKRAERYAQQKSSGKEENSSDTSKAKERTSEEDTCALKDRRHSDKPSRASSSADVPPPLPPPPSAQRTTAASQSAAAPQPASSTIRTRETSISMTDVASVRQDHYDPASISEADAPAAASVAPSHRSVVGGADVDALADSMGHHTTVSVVTSTRRSSVAVDATSAVSAAGASEVRERGDSVSYQTSVISSFASESHSAAFSGHKGRYINGSHTLASDVKEHLTAQRYSNCSSDAGTRDAGVRGGFCEKPVVAESGTQTEFVFVLDPLQGRQFMQLEQEQQILLEQQQQQRPQNVLQITDTRRSSHGIFTNMSTPRQSQRLSYRSVSPSEQQAAGVPTGVSPARMRRTGYANTSTNVRDLLRWD